MSEGHSHVHESAIDVSPKMRRFLVVTPIVLAAVVAIGMLVIGFGTDVESTVPDLLADDLYEAKVRSLERGPCPGTSADDGIDCELVEVVLTQGPHDGESRQLSFAYGSPRPELDDGDRVVLFYSEDAEEGLEYAYADRQRRPVLLAAALVFAIAVVLLGRLRGLAALAGLAVSLWVILQFILPAILEGHSPVVVAALGSAAIAFVALYVAHGFNMMTSVALLGTLAALFLTVVLSALFTALADFSGYASEEAVLLGQLATNVDVSGLLLGGIVIGALGALDDVTVTQAAAVSELRAANPDMSRSGLFRGAIRIGRDHIASTVNTLALAYAGAALPTMLLFLLSKQSLGTVANSEVVATEIVRTLVGSVGLVAAVPVTTWLAARVVGPRVPDEERPKPRRERPPEESGERSFW